MNEVIIRTTFRGADKGCRICKKSFEEHSWEQTVACVRAEQELVGTIACPTCGLLIGQHSKDEIVRCARKGRNVLPLTNN